MNVREYQIKQAKRRVELAYLKPKDPTEKAIIDLEHIICSIAPYSRWWRWGYISSLRLAINVLRNKKKRMGGRSWKTKE